MVRSRRSAQHVSSIDFKNSTALSDVRLLSLFRETLDGWLVGKVTIRVRYSRSADFSGTCVYRTRRIYINLGRHLEYPFAMRTNLAKVRTRATGWTRPVYTLELSNGYEVVLFVFLHELYHLLVKRARRNTRQKESMCDRFAARHLVDRFGAAVRTESGKLVPRGAWDFQDLEGFVAAARSQPSVKRRAARRPVEAPPVSSGQLLLFTP
jgi:hypothetical protein